MNNIAPPRKREYSPHVIIAWSPEGKVAIQDYSYYDEALDKYMELESLKCPKIILAKIIRQHGEG